MVLPPQSAYQIALGLETLALRLQRESASALAVAHFLAQHPQVKQVNYPGLPSSPYHPLAQQYLKNGYGAVLSFEVEQPTQFLRQLKVIRMAPNLGDSRTLVVHPWTTTHGRMPEASRRAASVTPNSIRMSVGLEDPSDLIHDIAQALT